MKTIKMSGYTIVLTGRADGDSMKSSHRVHAKYFSAKQVHGTNILSVYDDRTGKDKQDADAIIGKKGHSYLGVYTADCSPIALLGNKYFAVVHGSWKTLYLGLIHQVISGLKECGENPQELLVYMGPSIRRDVYEVGNEFIELFPEPFLIVKDGRLMFDLVGYSIAQLTRGEIHRDNIVIEPVCTYTDNALYFSHRKGDKERNFFGVN